MEDLIALPVAERKDIDWGRVSWLAEHPVSMPHGILQGMQELARQIEAISVERYEYEPYGIDANTAALPEYEPGKAVSGREASFSQPGNSPGGLPDIDKGAAK